jgi:hypothetical protein
MSCVSSSALVLRICRRYFLFFVSDLCFALLCVLSLISALLCVLQVYGHHDPLRDRSSDDVNR